VAFRRRFSRRAASATRLPRSRSRTLPHDIADAHSDRIVLPKSDRLLNQLVALERHVARGGRDGIDHPRDQHDDVANAAMGAAVLAGTYCGYNLELLARATVWD